MSSSGYQSADQRNFSERMNPKELSSDKNNIEQNESESVDEKYKDNLIFTWGFSKYGQTGHEYSNYILTPTMQGFSSAINADEYTSQLEIEPIAGENHTVLLIKDSEESLLYSFGKNIFGQLGLSENGYICDPTLVSSLNPKKNIKKVSLGGEHSLLLCEDRNIFSCGLNLFGQLGAGDNNNRSTFTNITPIYNNIFSKDETITDIVAGAQHSLLITSLNKVYYCGFNRNNFLGISDDINLFTFINDNKITNANIILIRAGMNLSGVLFEDKRNIALWGKGNILLSQSQEIVIININNIEPNASQSEEINDFKFGNDFMVVLLTNGDVYTCGANNKNQLGVENVSNSSTSEITFYKVSIEEPICGIEVGYDHTIAVSCTGKVFGWGSNLYGQIGQTKSSSFSTPTLIINPIIKDLKIYKLSCGGYHNIAIFKGNINDIPEEENHLNIYKNKIFFSMENHIQEVDKAKEIINKYEQYKNELNIKENIIDKKLEEMKKKKQELGIDSGNDLTSYNRGFENSFEISLDELEFEEENSEIGKGTFGDVLRGFWRGEDVAVKFLKGSMLDSPDSIKQFVDECNILKNLHHPNILLYMGACTTGPQFFVVTEFCDNGNLFEYLHINSNNKLNYDDARRIALEIAYGMNYLHGFKPPILHRDLKSMNILLDRNTTVKLADFGNTRSFHIQMTKQKGTFQWMAPEVIKGNSYTEKSDVFSFGVILNELVTRVPPYQGTDKKEVARRVVNNPNYRPPFNPKKVPKSWADLMVKCWQHDERKRPTFGEIIDMLKEAKLPGSLLIKNSQD